MKFPLAGALLAFGLTLAPAVARADLPAIKTSGTNTVPACATPGRLMSFVEGRNAKLDKRFSNVATEYMRHGEALRVRWDYAFFQMLVETGNLGFSGTVKASQNNFAGLGATGSNARGESFPDVSTGARAHLEHVLMYGGDHVDRPVAERTRNIQEWGVLDSWRKKISGPVTYTDLARKWAPRSRNYTKDISTIASAFFDGPCKSTDPHPELVAEARRDSKTKVVKAEGSTRKSGAENGDSEKPSGAEIAKRNIERERAEGPKERAGLGAGAVSPAAEAAKPAVGAQKTAPQPESSDKTAGTGGPKAGDKPAPALTDKGGEKPAEKGNGSRSGGNSTESAKAVKPSGDDTAQAAAKCRVYTASYGGQKSIIIKAPAPEGIAYTVLDVNDGQESREAEAYIAAYAKEGQSIGEFPTQEKALDKAFELCPEE